MEKINQSEKENKYFCEICGSYHSYFKPQEKPKTFSKTKKRFIYAQKIISWFSHLLFIFLKWLWSHPKKLITSILTAIGLWLLSFLPFKLPNLPFLPTLTQQSKPQETKKEDKKPEEKKEETKPSEQSKTNIVTTTVTNIVTQTNMVTQTNYVTETKYITNFVIQPIVVTNTIFKEVPVVITNVLIIKNGVTDTNANNKNGTMNGPAFFFTDDFNTLLQNQQQNPIRARMVNPN